VSECDRNVTALFMESRVAECDVAEACANMESSAKSVAARSTNPISRIIGP
jgi:hypothetical protein